MLPAVRYFAEVRVVLAKLAYEGDFLVGEDGKGERMLSSSVIRRQKGSRTKPNWRMEESRRAGDWEGRERHISMQSALKRRRETAW